MNSAVFAAAIGLLLLGAQLPRIALASPETTNFGVTPPGILSLITAVGDDVFSTTDLTVIAAAADPATHTQHFGPYLTTNDPDSGTCGNDWATDTFDRHFTVFFNRDGTVSSLVEQFKDGSFVTPAPPGDPIRSPNGPSPGACNTSPVPQGTVNDGITGDFHGYFPIAVPPGTTETSSSPYCDAVLMTNAGCTTTTFISTHFSSPVFTVTTFFFHYSAGDQSLIVHEWRNASPDRGGNFGDIRSANLP